ncbi:3,4-dihydroxy-2-butanone-4-phosphate synthase [Thermoplasmatales archaeon ex4484_36]|nr:MAG: 3,4-dihydroxy-2-butanone-4-phosphate synthase [Thermoplasmatales archaeon ex4484_36]RLF55343.1 MAG: 3,4-dihydroxy-2-butanone-4-phosphate synthase [Thermoplasmata archaeon]HDD60400.1 3,4-dihydroxy-2-butanone-4-phosphate synthase [Euryarchaeota archaeon]RLF72264.1 MAG: 3,4-dihydroxy-2-butanone-4-phosphate synthase [Thermoplasmata archaeon]RLF72465.1 MAG: 3,4-dihydroxy-2-butanone-4-phosphate synthase [Thermoplasmata archaeon]
MRTQQSKEVHDGKIEWAKERLERGHPIFIYDSDEREGEADMVFLSQAVGKEQVRLMRGEAGGLICVTLPPGAWKALELPFMTDILKEASSIFKLLKYTEADDIPYDERSSFSLTVNHRKTFTGITDTDRALTIRELGRFVEALLHRAILEPKERFGELFRSPGHVHLLNAREGLLDNRRGHTEYSTALLQMAGLTPSAAICEMLGEGGGARPLEEVKEIAEELDTPLFTGDELLTVWRIENEEG